MRRGRSDRFSDGCFIITTTSFGPTTERIGGCQSRLGSLSLRPRCSGDLTSAGAGGGGHSRARTEGLTRRAVSLVGARMFIAGALLLTACSCKNEKPVEYVRLSDAVPPGTLSDDNPVLVSFWASWCSPCVEETPSLRRLADDAPGGLLVRVLPVESTEADVVAAFPHGLSVQVLAQQQRERLVQWLQRGKLPVAFLIVDHRVVARFDGKRDWTAPDLRRLLARLIAEQHAD